MTTDAEVLGLLKAADPAPANSGARIPDLDLERFQEMELLVSNRSNLDLDGSRRPIRTYAVVLGAVAALVALFLVFGAAPDGDTVPADDSDPITTSASTTPSTVPASAEAVGLAEQFIQSRIDRDSDRSRTLLAPGVTTIDVLGNPVSVEDLGAMWTRYGDWEWTSENVDCTPDSESADGTVILCVSDERNALSELAGMGEMAGTTRFEVGETGIESVDWTFDLEEFGLGVFQPFFTWSMFEYPDETPRAWAPGQDGVFVPVLTDEGNAIFARHLAEYTAGNEPPPSKLQQFLDARSTGGPMTMLAEQVEITDLWVRSVDEYAAAAEFFEAASWTWDQYECLVLFEENFEHWTCRADRMTGFSPGRNRMQLSIDVGVDGITSVVNSVDAYPESQFETWHDWLAAEYPDDVAVLYGTDVELVPQSTPEALELFATRTEEFATIE